MTSAHILTAEAKQGDPDYIAPRHYPPQKPQKIGERSDAGRKQEADDWLVVNSSSRNIKGGQYLTHPLNNLPRKKS